MKTKSVKIIAIFLVVNILLDVFLPVVSQAIGSGPYAPEYNSFMPAGQGISVSPQTGDMSYNIPLMTLPCPEGDYPVNLFYQAGIKPEDDASWTGLGWNVNVGSISRNVVGIPDDYYNTNYQVIDESKGHANLAEVLDGATKARVITQNNFNSPYFVNFDVGFPANYNITNATTTRVFNQYGILHGRAAGLASVTGQNGNPNVMFDSYPLYDQTEDLTVDKNNPELFNGGTLPSYDLYTVSGQGIFGAIEPLVLENGSLFRQGKVEQYGSPSYDNPNVTMSYAKLKLFGTDRPKQQFRFKGEFSNSLLATPTAYNSINSNTDAAINFGTNGLGYSYAVPDANSLNATSLRFPGANHVEYYLNEEIIAGTAKSNGFLNYQGHTNTQRANFTYTNPANQVVSYPVDKQIGGFSVTNPNGTTYHYALPVYTNDQSKTYSYDMVANTTRNINRKIINQAPYAYTWLLTSVTGADFYDANNNGYADYGDWGRWTSFVYGKSTARYYSYRDPLAGERIDANGVKTVEQGYKELYYLEAGYSRTHSMLFIKDTRTDATSVYLSGINVVSNPLKLTSLVLLKNESVSKINTALGGTNTDFFACFGNISKASTNSTSPWSYTSIIDDKDIQAIVALSSAGYKSSVVSEVKLNYDYSLCPFIENQPLGNLTTSGKLTLRSVKFIGQNGASPLAPIEFNYEQENPVTANVFLTHVPGQLTDEGPCYGRINIGNSGSNLKEGDIIKMVFDDGKTYFATLTKGTAYNNPVVNLYDVIFLGNNIPGTDKIWTTNPAVATTTKNPPYTKNFFDVWGYFKSDYTGYNNTTKAEDISTTVNSSASTDVWSLRSILASNGSIEKIEYESDSYNNSAFNKMEAIKLSPKFQYTKTDGLFSTALSYCDFRTINKNSVYIFKAQEDIANRLSPGMQVQIATVGTYSRIKEAANDFAFSSEDKKTYFGTDVFEISSVSAPGTIMGHFVSTVGTPASNPFWMTPNGTYPDKKMFYHNTSFLYFDRNTSRGRKVGGGIRVSKLKVKENTTSGKEITTLYSYKDAFSGRTSGQVVSDPGKSIGNNNFNEEVPTQYNSLSPVNKYGDDAQTMLGNYDVKFLNLNKNALNAGSLLWNGVTYEYSTITKEVDGNPYPTYQQMRFKRMTEDMLSVTKTNDFAITDGSHYCTVGIVDNTAQAGSLLSTRSINMADNTVLSEIKYNYNSSLNDITNFQGVLEQVFHEKRVGASYGVGVVTKLSRYPNVLMNVVSTNYLKGRSETVVNKSYDLYTGSANKVETQDSYGNQFISETISAYNMYPEMGLKSLGVNYKNMLTQATSAFSYKYNGPINPVAKYTGASMTTWAKDNTIIRNQYTALSVLDDQIVSPNTIWRPSGTYDFNINNLSTDGVALTDPLFDWVNVSNNNINWIKSSQPKKYDPYSRLYLSSNANDINESIRYGYNGSKPIAVCDLGNNYEYTFSSAEDPNTESVQPSVSMAYTNETGYFGGDVFGVPLRDATYAHTGKYSVKLNSSGGQGFIYRAYIKPAQMIAGRTYKTSVWVYNNAAANNVSLTYYVYGINPNGSTYPTSTTNSAWGSAPAVTIGNWKLIDMVLTIPAFSGDYYIEFTCNNSNTTVPAWVDDFRIQPVESSMDCYVYDEVSDKVTYTLDKDNFYTRYEYDNIGRLIATYKETLNGEKKTNDYYYNYSRKP